jgi:hypothetical protein
MMSPETWKWASVKRIKEAAEELKEMIRAKYPDAQFQLSRSHDDRDAWNLWTYVEIEDLDDVRDLVKNRELDMLTEERIPILVVPTLDPTGFVQQAPASARKTG